MSRGLEYRQEGPVQTGIWENLGLGMRPHKARQVTDGRPVPLTLTAPVVADARLDNHRELCSQLELNATSSTTAEVIAKAFSRWGERCTDHLLGDFAFAVFDTSKNRLFCARDHFGVRPFYYTQTKRYVAFATDPRALTAIDGAPRKLCNQAVLDYLLNHFPDSEKFFLDGILKLPPAYQLFLRGARLSKRQYWALRPERTVWNMEPEKAVSRFRAIFSQAVESRLGPQDRTATFLSGGLDSSSVTARTVMAARARGDERPIKSFASVFPDVPEADESDWIKKVVDFLNRDYEAVQLHVSGGEESGPVRRAAEMTAALGEPVLAPNQYFTWDMVAQAAGTGVDVILTGHDGDSVVGHAMYDLTNLALDGRFDALDAELEVFLGMLEQYQSARRRLLNSYVSPAVGIAVRKLQFIRAFRLAQALHRRYGLSRKAVIQQAVPLFIRTGLASFRRKTMDSALLKDGPGMRWRVFRRQLANAERWETRPELQHVDSLRLNAISATFETFDKIGAAHGIELRHPFFDKRLVEFCVSLPISAKLRDGHSRWVLRAAMAEMLPQDVRLRRSKTNLGPSFSARLAKDAGQILETLEQNAAHKSRYLNEAALSASTQQLKNVATEGLSVQVHTALCMTLYDKDRASPN